MDTENVQTDVTSSEVSTESAAPEVSQSSESQASGLDKIKEAAKVAKSAEEKFEAKPLDDSLSQQEKDKMVAQAPAYQPNFNYVAAAQQKEIEEFWRPLIKDKESEERVKEFLTKYDAFDSVKESRNKIQEHYDSLLSDYEAQAQVVNRVESALDRGDLSSAFRQLGLKDEDIFKWTQQRLQMMELPPEQRAQLEAAEQQRLQQFELEDERSYLEKQYQEQAVQVRTMQLDMVLNRSDVSQAAQAWDKATGEFGAFKNLVISEAQNTFHRTGQDLTPEQAVQQVMQRFGKLLPQQGGAGEVVPQAHTAQSQTPVAPLDKPVIPNINGKGASPIKKVPRSLDDLKKLQKEAALNGF